MNRDIVQGNWKQICGWAASGWSSLLRDQPGVIAGRRTQFEGQRQWAYGIFRSKSLWEGVQDHHSKRTENVTYGTEPYDKTRPRAA
jgi:hypothetical protein